MNDVRPLTETELVEFRAKHEHGGYHPASTECRLVATIDALKAERDEAQARNRDLAQDLAINASMLAKETDAAREAETNEMAAKRERDKLKAERDGLRAENVMLREVMDSMAKRTYKMWPVDMANALLSGIHHDAGEALKAAPKTAKIQAVLEAAEQLDAHLGDLRGTELVYMIEIKACQAWPQITALVETVHWWKGETG